MKKRYALIISISIAIAAIFGGSALNPAIRNAYLGPALGSIVAMYISWLIEAAVRENENLNKADETSNDFQEIDTILQQLNTRCAHGNPIFNPR